MEVVTAVAFPMFSKDPSMEERVMFGINNSWVQLVGVVSILLLGFATLPRVSHAATCTGSDPCNACKNCKYCKHCAKDGGTCGVCK